MVQLRKVNRIVIFCCALIFFFSQLDDKEGFNEKFIHFLKYAMIIYRREPTVERVINFAAGFVTSFYHVETEDGSKEGEEDNLLLNYVFKFLLEVQLVLDNNYKLELKK